MQLLKSNYSYITSELTVKSFHLTRFFQALSSKKKVEKVYLLFLEASWESWSSDEFWDAEYSMAHF